MAVNMPVARQQFTDGNGAPLVGGSVAFCQPGTGGATYLSVWADENQTIPLTNPVPLDSAGITMSGGSQVSVWGSGLYEQFVRDAEGNLIYSALVNANLVIASNLVGPVRIQGDLSVVGSITDTQSLTTPLINGSNANFAGALSAGGMTVGNLQVNGSAGVAGNLNVSGAIGVGGQLSAAGISTSQDIQMNGFSLDNASNVGANTVNASNVNTGALNGGLSKIFGGTAVTDSAGNAAVPFPAPFNGVAAICTGLPGVSEGFFAEIVNVTTSGFGISTTQGGSPAPGISVFWIAVGD